MSNIALFIIKKNIKNYTHFNKTNYNKSKERWNFMKKRGVGVLAMAAVLAIAGCSCDNGGLSGVAKTVDEAKEYSVDNQYGKTYYSSSE